MIARVLRAALVLAVFPALLHAQIAADGGGALGYYQPPASHGDVIVFAAEGDLWRVASGGGLAQRLTTHPAEESSPVISPDGRTVAFTARYEGPAELYTMPIEGGLPVRWTHESDASIATGWSPDGDVLYTTPHYSTLPQNQLVKINLETGARERVPLYTASEGAYDSTGRTLYFVRPAFHNNVTKQYKGGTARDVWKFVDGAPEAVELTGDYDGESHSPMWWDGRVYFVTDRDGAMNIWSMDENGGGLRQHTRHEGWDVQHPDLQSGRITYQVGADLWMYDIASGRNALIPVSLASDLDQLRERWVDPMENLTSAHLDAEGERVVVTARGRVFVAPVQRGRLVRASVKPGVRYRDVAFMPGGERLIGLSDESGEFEWVTLPANGIGPERVLTEDGSVLRYEGVPSPNGARVAYVDHRRDLWVLDVESGEQKRINQQSEGTADQVWSADSRWLAFVETAPNTFRQIKLYDTQGGGIVDVTSDRVNSQSPSWGPDGDFLYFLSDRNLSSTVQSPWGARQPEPHFADPWEIYHVSLRKGIRSPFAPDDELAERAERDSADDSEDRDVEIAIAIDLDGIQRRAKKLPVPAGSYSALSAGEAALFYVSREDGATALMAVPITNEDPEPVEVAGRVARYELSADGNKLLLVQGTNLSVIDARAQRANDLADARVDMSAASFAMDVREDWRQIYVDAWRMERDYFYDPGMHGLDWEAVRNKYMPLVDRVTTRAELSDVIGEVIGELSVLHASVRGGDMRTGDDNVQVASLGARLARDAAGGGYRVEYIYQSDPDYPDEMSPLADPDVGVENGDLIEAVNGVGTLDVPHIGALLRNQVGELVRLRVRPGAGGPVRDIMVEPIGNERNLRYSDWEYTRRLEVEDKGEGQIGYLHMRAMSGGNLTEWYRNFYPVFDRQGLVIDMRRNTGGNIDSFILEKLMRRAWMYWKENVGEPSWNMQYAFRGHMVVLVDQNTASDGEAFADGFRRLGLGEVIGMRTWGGEVWLGSSNRLTDNGLARAPSMGVYGPEGEWLIEQIGIVPDIVVDNLPHATFNGEDAQLDAAIEYLRRKIAEDPRPVPAAPEYPNKARRRVIGDSAGGGAASSTRRPS
jgi:tricorn protease